MGPFASPPVTWCCHPPSRWIFPSHYAWQIGPEGREGADTVVSPPWHHHLGTVTLAPLRQLWLCPHPTIFRDRLGPQLRDLLGQRLRQCRRHRGAPSLPKPQRRLVLAAVKLGDAASPVVPACGSPWVCLPRPWGLRLQQGERCGSGVCPPRHAQELQSDLGGKV